MKYIAVLDTDEFEDFNFFEDGKEKYLHAIDANSVNGEWIYLPFKPLEQEPIPKNDLGVDCISRKAALDITWHDPSYSDPLNVLTEVRDKIRELPSVTPQEPQSFKWCTDCREYDQEKHCCHRWSKAIRDTVEEMKQEQEPRWIPVNERLPESDEEYHTFLVTDNKGRVALSEFYLSISDRKPYWIGMIDVLAWMPLPQPYEPQESEVEDGKL